jgi:hypothetical protein
MSYLDGHLSTAEAKGPVDVFVIDRVERPSEN